MKIITSAIKTVLRWYNIWLVHIWLGVPLLGGVVWTIAAYSDERGMTVYDDAMSSPRIVELGTITANGPRNKNLLFTNGEKNRKLIYCNLIEATKSSCLFGKNFPLKAKIEVFQTKHNDNSYWIILSVESNNSIIVSENDQLKSLKGNQNDSRSVNYYTEFFMGFFFSLIFYVPILIILKIFTRFVKFRRSRKGLV